MAGDASTVGTSSFQVAGEGTEPTIEINIKTLDSKIYTFRVNKDMPVMSLKEKLVGMTGVAVDRQRLIFRGKVLKDDHLLSEYHLEDGHTLHLVARQPIEGQTSSQASPGSTAPGNNNQGDASTPPGPRIRVGQASHGVLIGTVNVADQGESMVADIGRLVGTVLNSLGVGTGALNGSASTSSVPTQSNQTPSGPGVERNQNASGGPASANLSSPGFTVLNHPFRSLHQIPQFPSAGFFSQQMTLPDSLTTLSEFISRMELAMQDTGFQSSPDAVHDPPRNEIPPLGARGLPTLETLRTVLEQTQRLLGGNATVALARLATRLEGEGASIDTVVRGQIQAEAVHLGAAIQHLGAMLLELGRTIMTLRMGQSPGESAVNAGPAVYISPTGPNPIMVQPFPLQANSLFPVPRSITSNGNLGPTSNGDPSRNINIYIHAGSPFIAGVSNAATRASSGEAADRELSDTQQASREGNGTGGSGPTRAPPPRTVVATIPARQTTQTTGPVLSVIYPVHVRSQLSVPIHSGTAQGLNPAVNVSAQPTTSAVSQPSSESGAFSNLVAQIGAEVINALAGGAQGLGSVSNTVQSNETQGSQARPGWASQMDQTAAGANELSDSAQGCNSSSVMQSTDLLSIEGPQSAALDPFSSVLSWDGVNAQAKSVDAGESSAVSNVPGIRMSGSEGPKPPGESSHDSNSLVLSGSSGINVNSSVSTTPLELSKAYDQISNNRSKEHNSELVAIDRTAQSGQKCENDRPTPLGLGLGGLQPKRREKTEKPMGKDKVLSEPPVNQEQSIARGQQFLNSLISQSSIADGAETNAPSNPETSLISQIMDGFPSGRQESDGQEQVGATEVASHIIQTPIFSNYLSGVAEDTGIASSDLRSMLEQFTQSSVVRDMVYDVAQQLGQSRSGEARGQGGLDLSRMIQQMMPVVSHALGGLSRPTPTPGLQSNFQTQHDDDRSGVDDMPHEINFEVDLQRAAEMVERNDGPRNVFRSVLESASMLIGDRDSMDNLVNSLADNEELSDDFMSMLQRDLHRRMQSDSGSER